MDVMHYDGGFKAFLHDDRSSAFPELEQEYLLGHARWRVTQMKEETLVFEDEDQGNVEFPCYVIYLYNQF